MGNYFPAFSSLRIKIPVGKIKLDSDIVKCSVTNDCINDSFCSTKPCIHNPMLYLCECTFYNNMLSSLLHKKAPGPSWLHLSISMFNNYYPNSDLMCFPLCMFPISPHYSILHPLIKLINQIEALSYYFPCLETSSFSLLPHTTPFLASKVPHTRALTSFSHSISHSLPQKTSISFSQRKHTVAFHIYIFDQAPTTGLGKLCPMGFCLQPVFVQPGS